MKYIIISLMLSLLLSSCQLYRQDVTGDVTITYTSSNFNIKVVFEDQKTYDIVIQALYWHSELVGHPVSIASEEFLKKVLPLVDSDVSSIHPIYISTDEAAHFYKNRFKDVRKSLKKQKNSEEFHVDIEGIE